MNGKCKVIIGDSRRMPELDDGSVHLIVTSPPYWQLKDYGGASQVGFHDTYEEYINNISLVWNECARVLAPGCRLCVNIGDQFARSAYYGRYKVIPIRTEIIKFCESAGMDYMGSIIWQKVTTTNTSGGATIMGSFPFPRNGIIKLDYEFILLFRKYGAPPKPRAEEKEKSRMTTEEWNEYFSGHWSFPGVKQSGHLAMFPEELPRRLIRMFSFPAETVLDPFLGSGTTCGAASALGRDSVGCEINEEFLPVIKEKLGVAEDSLFSDSGAEVEVVRRPGPEKGLEEDIARLPYIFRDPVKIGPKADALRKRYGSKIDGKEKQKKKYYRVKEVTDSERLVLKDGTRIRLIGIREKPEHAFSAVDFIARKTKGSQVFLKFDEQAGRTDDDGNILCYLYLRNKTFINAHLIKQGLASVDEKIEFEKKELFKKYAEKNKT